MSEPAAPPPKHGLLHDVGEVLGFAWVGATALVEACIGWWPELRRDRDTGCEADGEDMDDEGPCRP